MKNIKKLAAYYFSGTGNTKYVTEKRCESLKPEYDCSVYDISHAPNADEMKQADLILFAFPVYGSAPPQPMRRFLYNNKDRVSGKKLAIIVTQYMFSGEGAASLGRAAEKYGGRVEYAEHFNMPNNISDCNIFKIRNGEDIIPMLEKTDMRIEAFAKKILSGVRFRRGFGVASHALGFLSQRALFRKGESKKRDKLKIDGGRCTGCGACVKQCPAGNLVLSNGKARPSNVCALCYRCVNLCPNKAITLIGKHAPEVQYKGVGAVKR